MKRIVLGLFIAALFGQTLFAQERIFHCSNQSFLVGSLELRLFEGELSVVRDSSAEACLLSEKDHGVFTVVNPESDNCFLMNLSRPDWERGLISIELRDELFRGRAGYMKVELDNSLADYGPETLKSFLYCR